MSLTLIIEININIDFNQGNNVRSESDLNTQRKKKMNFLSTTLLFLVLSTHIISHAEQPDTKNQASKTCRELCKSAEESNKLNEIEHNKYIQCRSEQECGNRFETNQKVGSSGAAVGGVSATQIGILLIVLLLII